MSGGRFVSLVLGATGFCVSVEHVLQVMRLENVLDIPRAPRFVTGVINLRGDVVPVIDLHERLGIPEIGSRKRRIVVVGMGSRSYGLVVDGVREIVEASAKEMTEDPSARSEFTRGFIRRGEEILHILDLPRIVSAEGPPERLQADAPAIETGARTAE
jgi:purine-binding chemotaxis protein CheW